MANETIFELRGLNEPRMRGEGADAPNPMLDALSALVGRNMPGAYRIPPEYEPTYQEYMDRREQDYANKLDKEMELRARERTERYPPQPSEGADMLIDRAMRGQGTLPSRRR